MDRYEWPGDSETITISNVAEPSGVWEEGPSRVRRYLACGAVAREILRLAEREKQLLAMVESRTVGMERLEGLRSQLAERVREQEAETRQLREQAEPGWQKQYELLAALNTRIAALEKELERWQGLVGRRDSHINQVREQLRIECAELGDNDWPDSLHLGDVIEKHLARPAAARIAALEEDLSVARKGWGEEVVQHMKEAREKAKVEEHLARLDALLESEEPPEEFTEALLNGTLHWRDAPAGARTAWRWLREQLKA